MNNRELANAKWRDFAKRHIFWDEFNLLYIYTIVYHYSVRKAAAELGVPKSTLYDRLKKYNLTGAKSRAPQ